MLRRIETRFIEQDQALGSPHCAKNRSFCAKNRRTWGAAMRLAEARIALRPGAGIPDYASLHPGDAAQCWDPGSAAQR
jgi:hypothetical protein